MKCLCCNVLTFQSGTGTGMDWKYKDWSWWEQAEHSSPFANSWSCCRSLSGYGELWVLPWSICCILRSGSKVREMREVLFPCSIYQEFYQLQMTCLPSLESRDMTSDFTTLGLDNSFESSFRHVTREACDGKSFYTLPWFIWHGPSFSICPLNRKVFLLTITQTLQA